MQIPGQQPALNVNLNPAAGQQQNPGLAQNNFGANQGMPQNAGIQQQNPNLGLQPNAGQFQQAPGQQGPQINNQFNPNPQPNQGQQPGNFGGFGIQNPGDAYDPQKPQFDGILHMLGWNFFGDCKVTSQSLMFSEWKALPYLGKLLRSLSGYPTVKHAIWGHSSDG